MIDTKPLVSICIPTYNGGAYIEEALTSAINQTYPNLEIVVSDDASQDKTLAIVEEFKTKTSIPIHVYEHIRQGIGGNWNHCASKAQGDYIKFLFQDDILYPTCIERLVKLAQQSPRVGLVYCLRDFIHDSLEQEKYELFKELYGNLHLHWDSFQVEEGVLPGTLYLKDLQLLNSPKNKIGEPSAVLLKRDVFNEVGWFDTKLQQTLDCEFWYRVMTKFDVGFVNEPLMGFRLHHKQASSVNKSRNIPDKSLLYKRYYQKLFWYLHPRSRWKLLKLHHPLLKLLLGIKKKINA